jgi:ABC-type transporter Mla maintaining outer membrane lipid asymmetry permease subunit MlaE
MAEASVGLPDERLPLFLEPLAAAGAGTRRFAGSLFQLATYFVRTVVLIGRRGTWSRLTWSLASDQVVRFAMRTLPLFLFLGLLLGVGTGFGVLNPLRDIKQHTTAGPILFSIFAFSLSPLMTSFWYLLFSGPSLAAETARLKEGGEIRALQNLQVDTFGAFAVPTAVAGISSLFILSSLLNLSAAVSLWMVWELVLGHPLSELLDFWVGAVTPALLWGHPFKLFLLGFSLPLIPLHLGQKSRSGERDGLSSGFFAGFVLVVTIALSIETLCLLLTRF